MRARPSRAPVRASPRSRASGGTSRADPVCEARGKVSTPSRVAEGAAPRTRRPSDDSSTGAVPAGGPTFDRACLRGAGAHHRSAALGSSEGRGPARGPPVALPGPDHGSVGFTVYSRLARNRVFVGKQRAPAANAQLGAGIVFRHRRTESGGARRGGVKPTHPKGGARHLGRVSVRRDAPRRLMPRPRYARPRRIRAVRPPEPAPVPRFPGAAAARSTPPGLPLSRLEARGPGGAGRPAHARADTGAR